MATLSNTTVITSLIVPLAIDNPQAVQVISTNIILVVLVSLWTLMRMYSRHIRQVAFSFEDGLYFISLILFYAFVVLAFLMVFLGGAGHHSTDLQPSAVAWLMKFGYATQVLYALSLGLCKISVLLLLKRVFGVAQSFYIACWVLISFVVAWMTMTILIGLLICHPIAMNWDTTLPGGYCGDEISAYSAVGIIDLVIDIAIFILPIPIVVKLQVSTAHKMALGVIFGAGILTIIFGGLRLRSVFLVDFTDFSYSSPVAVIWAIAEVGVALVISSSPLLRPVFDRVFSRLISTLRSTSHHRNTRTGRGGLGNDASPSVHLDLMSPARAGGCSSGAHKFQYDGFMPMEDSEENLVVTSVVRGGPPRGKSEARVYAGSRRGKREMDDGSSLEEGIRVRIVIV